MAINRAEFTDPFEFEGGAINIGFKCYSYFDLRW